VKTTVWLLVTTLLLLSGLWLLREHQAARKPSAWRDRPLLSIGPEEATALAIESDGLNLRLERHGADWFLVYPLRARADASAVERVLTLLDMSYVRDAVTAVQRRDRELALEDYGLERPRAVFAVETGARREIVLLGDAAPLGRYLFAQRKLSDDVLVIEPGILDAIPETIDRLRDHRLVRGRERQVRRVEVQAPGRGFIQLVRHADGWRLHQPLAAPADEAAVMRLIGSVFKLEAARFYWDMPLEGADGTGEVSPRAYYEASGLAEDVASLRIGIWLEGDDLGQELFFGSRPPDSPDRVYARRRDVASIVEVDASRLEPFAVSHDTLRDRRLFLASPDTVTGLRIEHAGRILDVRYDADGWHIREPVDWLADPAAVRLALAELYALRARGFPAGTASDDLAAAGLDPPAWRISVTYRDGESRELALGGVVTDDGTRWVTPDGGDSIIAVDNAALAGLLRQGVVPLHYRDRTVLELSPGSIWRLARESTSATQQVERIDGRWHAADSDRFAVRPGVPDAIVNALRLLRAESVKAQNPPELAVYGLEQPPLALTVGLRGDAGIQKTLYFGFLATSGGVYARVRGQDLVFILDRAMVDTLTAPLVTRQEPPPAADGGAP